MASFGLLGAIGGIGEALQTVGKGMEERRQAALKAAADEAKERRLAVQRAEDRRDAHQDRLALVGARTAGQVQVVEAKADATVDKVIPAQTAARKEVITATGDKEVRVEGVKQKGRVALQDDRQAGARDLASYRATLTAKAQQDRAAQRKLEKLDADPNIRSLSFGKPDPRTGMAAAYGVMKDGSRKPLGWEEYRPPKAAGKKADTPLTLRPRK